MKLTEDIISVLQNQRPIPIATCTIIEDNLAIPNLVYVSFIKPYNDETILIADNKFYKTRINLETNPEIAITVYNPESNKSYQIKGRVTIHENDEIYEEGKAWVQSRKSSLIPKAIVLVHIHDIYCKDKKLSYNENDEPMYIKNLI
ncbi:MAG: pyridoxamine 5-phosphate oxidase-related, FMN-binding protein [Clostridiaceae bacterium]|nr:pyridoxamine 5-phosphate oxidase-related, FMN-binding protein [Clostridiaceae bacterium]